MQTAPLEPALVSRNLPSSGTAVWRAPVQAPPSNEQHCGEALLWLPSTSLREEVYRAPWGRAGDTGSIRKSEGDTGQCRRHFSTRLPLPEASATVPCVPATLSPAHGPGRKKKKKKKSVNSPSFSSFRLFPGWQHFLQLGLCANLGKWSQMNSEAERSTGGRPLSTQHLFSGARSAGPVYGPQHRSPSLSVKFICWVLL